MIDTVLACTPGCQKAFHCEIEAPTPASRRSFEVIGELYVPWMKRFGSKRYPPPTSCSVVATVDPQLQACWLSLRMLNLCLAPACHVSRPRYVSYHSQRPL